MPSNSNNSGRNRVEVPQAREALNRFKMEVASEIGVPLKQGYNGDLTSAQNGSVGGEMVRRMIRKQEEAMSGAQSYQGGQQ
jgi:small acid-soluble spore protein alpha/beta type